jgi:hypothetical protein
MNHIGGYNPDISGPEGVNGFIPGGYAGLAFLNKHDLFGFVVVARNLGASLHGNFAYHDSVGGYSSTLYPGTVWIALEIIGGLLGKLLPAMIVTHISLL